jgi:hypothetical protein
MKKAICPLISLTLVIVAVALGFELWSAKRPHKPPVPRPPTARTVHTVAQIELALGRKDWASSCGASNPDILTDMETLRGINLRSLPHNQRELLRDVAWRLAGADSGYSAVFLASHRPMADYSDRSIVGAAAQSVTPPRTGPAYAVLEQIYRTLPSIYKEPMDCSHKRVQ